MKVRRLTLTPRIRAQKHRPPVVQPESGEVGVVADEVEQS
jgi:hypothetical protein